MQKTRPHQSSARILRAGLLCSSALCIFAVAPNAAHAASGSVTDLGGLGGVEISCCGGYSSEVEGVSDGGVVVGDAILPDNITDHAFIWTQGGGIVDLGALGGDPAGTGSDAFAVSANGSVVVGDSSTDDTNTADHAFRWTQGGGMADLGALGGDPAGTDSVAFAVSANGSVVVGDSSTDDTNAIEHAFRWTQGGGMADLGALGGDPAGTGSEAAAVSATGKVVVGYSFTDDTNSNTHAFRWTQSSGMQDLNTLLGNAGVNMTGIVLEAANGISPNGRYIAGGGTFSGSSIEEAFLVSYDDGTIDGIAGLVTPGALQTSLASAASGVSSQTLGSMNVGVGQSLMAAEQGFSESSGSGVSSGSAPSKWSAYAVGSLGLRQDNDPGDHGLNGTTGLKFQATDNLSLGAGVIGSGGRAALGLGGHSDLDAIGGSVIAAYQTPEGLRLSGSAFTAYLDEKTDRAYMNGAGISSSEGETHGLGYGAVGKAGWQFNVTRRDSLTPYAELEWSQADLDSYRETTGPFPAEFSDTRQHRTVGRIGVEAGHAFTQALEVKARAAWGHQIGGEGGGLTATSAGIAASAGPQAGDSNWAEGGVTLVWQATPAMQVTGDLASHTGQTPEPEETATLGLSYKF